MPDCNPPDQQMLIKGARKYLSLYEDMADMIRLGAYKRGTDPDLDQAINLYPQLETFISQDKGVSATFNEGFETLKTILGNVEMKKAS